jgi:hypothetical protein
VLYYAAIVAHCAIPAGTEITYNYHYAKSNHSAGQQGPSVTDGAGAPAAEAAAPAGPGEGGGGGGGGGGGPLLACLCGEPSCDGVLLA